MKSNLLHQSIAVGVGAVLLFAAQSANADEPKHKRHAKVAQTGADHNDSTAKRADRTGKIPTIDGNHSTAAVGREVGGANGQETRVPTGSHIPQTYQRRGYTTDRADNSFIYDQNDIRLRSTNNTADSLRSVPGITVRGPR